MRQVNALMNGIKRRSSDPLRQSLIWSLAKAAPLPLFLEDRLSVKVSRQQRSEEVPLVTFAGAASYNWQLPWWCLQTVMIPSVVITYLRICYRITF